MLPDQIESIGIFIAVIALILIALWPLIPGINFESLRKPKSDWLRATVRVIWSPIGIFGLVLAVVSTIFLLLASFFPEREGLYTNLGTEGLGITVTIVAIGIVNEWLKIRELKAQLIRDMGGQVNDFSLRAVRELRMNGWLGDGTLIGADLYEANLEDADLAGAILDKAILRKANLKGAKLFMANLEGASLWDANLEDADLRLAHLENAKLWEANLEGADLMLAHLEDTEYTYDTNWPEGFDANAKGAKLTKIYETSWG